VYVWRPVRSVDVHQHLWPPTFVEALAGRSDPPRLTDRGRRLELADGAWDADLADHDVDRRLVVLDRDEVDVAVVSLPPTLGVFELPELVEAYHEGIAEVVAASSGRLVALSAGAVRDGFPGVCVSALDLADDLDALAPLLREAEASGRFVFVHPGPSRPRPDVPAWWGAVVDYTAQQQAAYARWLAHGAAEFPRLRVVFAILAGGAPIQLERLRSRGWDVRLAQNPNVLLDTASYGRRALELCLATFGIGSLVYGSDFPVVDSHPTAQALGEFGAAVTDAVRRENPSLLLP
jgi:6-methylsalicylate decarboxylase